MDEKDGINTLTALLWCQEHGAVVQFKPEGRVKVSMRTSSGLNWYTAERSGSCAFISAVQAIRALVPAPVAECPVCDVVDAVYEQPKRNMDIPDSRGMGLMGEGR